MLNLPMTLSIVHEILKADANRMGILKHVQSLNLNDSWIGAGFVRNAIWDYVHEIKTPTTEFDIDVIYFDPKNINPETDLELEKKLLILDPKQNWSVKNQARMHERNNELPYINCADAISKWPETATSIAARINEQNELEIIAPFGYVDIFELNIKPTPHFQQKMEIFQERVKNKNWVSIWSKLKEGK